MRLNRSGFTLVEMLAVVVILGLLIGIMVPSVNSLINKNKVDSFKSLENNIRSAAQSYFSDYRYEVSVDISQCGSKNLINVDNINDKMKKNTPGKLPIKVLIDDGYLKTGKDGNIKNPMNNKILKINESYVTVTYNCNKKDFVYSFEDSDLSWQ